MITQAMILSAGKGTRMRPLTLTKPKPLIEVGGKSLIVWHIERLIATGIKDIVINAGYLGDVLEDALRGMNFACRLHISQESSEPLETAGGVKLALHRQLLRDEPFILINGDVWTNFDFRVLAHHYLTGLAHLILIENPDHNVLGDFVLHDNKVFAKTQLDMTSKALTFAGISLLSPRLFDDLTVGDKMALAPILIKAMNCQKITGQKIDDVWVDVGTMARLEALEQYLSNQYPIKKIIKINKL